jgi:hypothetical protein
VAIWSKLYHVFRGSHLWNRGFVYIFCALWSSSIKKKNSKPLFRRSQGPRGLRRRSAAARLSRSWVQIQPWAWMFIECCVLSGRGLCDELITRPEKSYRLWCVMCDLENLKNVEAMTRVGSQRHRKKKPLFQLGLYFPVSKPWIKICANVVRISQQPSIWSE